MYEPETGEDEEKGGALESSKNETAIATTGTFFLLFLVPVAFGLFGFPINLYEAVSVAIHEVGHLVFGIIGSVLGAGRILGVAGGTLFEYLNPLLAVIIFARTRRGAALAMVFLACMGSAMPYTARYMENASDPYGGTSYFGHIIGTSNDMNPQNHDWYIMFSEWSLLGKERAIADYVRTLGEALVLIGVIGAIVGFWFLMNYSPAGFAELALVGGMPSALYFGVVMKFPQLTICLVLIALAVFWLAATNWWGKRGRKLVQKTAKH
jgi:hypothetical protein